MPELKAAPSVLALRQVTAYAPDGTTLLDDVSFSAARGSLVAVVGPTGAGKTSLARALTGSLPLADGSIQVNGVIAFVPQHNTLHVGLSLALSLWYAAKLRLPRLNDEQRADRVATVLTELGLEAHADTTVRDLSVGQCKRANVAAQLLGDPDVIVLDEPTAGLDPGYERVVLNMLRDLADAGRTVITVTHSIDSLRACDRVLFLASGGSVAFFGPPSQAAKYFKLKDPADVFMALDTAQHHSWQDKFRAHPLYKRYVQPVATEPVTESTPKPVGFRDDFGRRKQVSMLVRRHADLLRSDKRHLMLLAAQGPVIGALLWAVLPPNGLVPTRTGGFSSHAAIVVMFVVLSTTWLGVTNAIREIVKEREIVRSEVGAGLSPRAYVTAKAISLGGQTMVQSALIAFIATARQGSPSHGLFIGSTRLELIAIAMITGFAACALGLAISATAKSADKALAVLPMTLVLQLVLAGDWAQDARMPLIRQIRSLVGARWGMEAMQASLTRNAVQGWIALGATAALAGGALFLATRQVAHATRPARVRRTFSLPQMPTVPNVPRLVSRHLVGLGAAAAVTLSLAAGGTGVVAMTRANNDAAPLAGAATATTETTIRQIAAPAITTPSTSPTTVGPPVTQPVAAEPRKSTLAIATDPVPVPELVSTPIVPVPEIVVPAPSPSVGGLLPGTPTATPAAAPTNPLSGLFKLFQIFAPRSN